jgi:hypothetical protein
MTALVVIMCFILVAVCICAVGYFVLEEYKLEDDLNMDGKAFFMKEYHKIKSQRENGS